jgi:aminoglycoside phosphotransferase (APT) family kinase protein
MNKHFKNIILSSTGAKEAYELETIQTLWSGYGQIVRYELSDSPYKTVVVKHVQPPNKNDHPRGWNTDLSHKRKLKSYKVETAWYRDWSKQCTDDCKTPACFALETHGDEVFMVLEDLDASGYAARKNNVSWEEMKACLSWLANFHATYLGQVPDDLWKNGTYWQLDTRPDELKILDDIPLKKAASAIDNKLKQCTYKTFVHGDAKLANFCFTKDGQKVAAVDFQYVGGGCGMKDIAYFVGSCLHEEDCEALEADILNCYFKALTKAFRLQNKEIDIAALEKEWRALYPVAWTDFHRFIKGWSPGHWKINSYSEKLATKVIKEL